MTMRQVMIFLTALIVLAVCSCSSKTITDLPSGIYVPDPLQQIEQNLDKNETVTRKIIKEGSINFRTADVNRTKALIVQTVQELDGYISKDNVYDDDDEQVKHSLTIRVPADKFDVLLSTISASIDRIEYKSIDVLDVTEEFVDVESRVKTKKELQARYKELLSKATKVEEMLQIERELGELQTEI